MGAVNTQAEANHDEISGPPAGAVVPGGPAGDGAGGVPSPMVPSMGPGVGISKPTPGPSALDDLKASRASNQRQLSALGTAREGLDRAAMDVRELEAEQRLLDDDASAALASWVKAGCDGPQPALDVDRGADVAQRLATAQGAVRAAEAPIAEVDAQVSTFNGKLVDLDGQIGAEILGVLSAEFEARHAEVCAELARLNENVTAVSGFWRYLTVTQKPEALRLAEKLVSRLRFQIAFSEADLDRAAGAWKAMAERLAE